jgi:hypothetical protein
MTGIRSGGERRMNGRIEESNRLIQIDHMYRMLIHEEPPLQHHYITMYMMKSHDEGRSSNM